MPYAVVRTRILPLGPRCVLISTSTYVATPLIEEAWSWRGACTESALLDGLIETASRLSGRSRPGDSRDPVVAALPIAAGQLGRLEQRDERLISTLSEYLVASLVRSMPRVVPSESVESFLNSRRAASRAECFDVSCQHELGRRVGASHSLVAGIEKQGKECVLTLKLRDLVNGASVRGAVSRNTCSAEGLRRAIDSAVADMKRPKNGPNTAGGDCVLLEGEEPGFVAIDSEPRATVYYGDMKLGETPLVGVKLPAGCVKVTLKNFEVGFEVQRVIRVKPDETLRYVFALRYVLDFDESDPPPLGRQLGPEDFAVLKSRCWSAIKQLNERDRPWDAASLTMEFTEAAATENVLRMATLLHRVEGELRRAQPKSSGDSERNR
ncbi:MAG: hypothetical protein HY791_26780 [Deltaproteobacteria bacterium]|nr:hypothetical protein [Deltaproteobacteria bacterium]